METCQDDRPNAFKVSLWTARPPPAIFGRSEPRRQARPSKHSTQECFSHRRPTPPSVRSSLRGICGLVLVRVSKPTDTLNLFARIVKHLPRQGDRLHRSASCSHTACGSTHLLLVKNMAMQRRDHLSEDIKKQVRQRCHFGCVICGLPLYHYDHIENYSAVGIHHPDNITLLCGTHHDEKTRKFLPVETVVAANANPFNSHQPDTAGWRWHFPTLPLRVDLGSNQFECTFLMGPDMVILEVYGEEIIGFEKHGNDYLININIRGSDNKRVLSISRNEIRMNTSSTDITTEGGRVVVRSPRLPIPLTIVRSLNGLKIESASFFKRGGWFMIGPDGLQNLSGSIRIGRTKMVDIGGACIEIA